MNTMENVFHGHTSSIMHGAMLVGVWYTKLGQTPSTFIHPLGDWDVEEGGLGEWVWREGWLELRGKSGSGRGGGRARWADGRERQLHNFTILHTDGWMLMGPSWLWQPRRHKQRSDDASSRAFEAPSRICQQHPRATQHEKTWVRGKNTQLRPSAWTNTQVSFWNY
jgi:hypothetical protein